MNAAITVELQFFLISILWGAVILLGYDILRIFRRLIPHNSFFLALEDLIFWVLTSVFIFAMIYTMNNGTIRGFSVMGIGIGMTLYHFVLSELVVKWITKVLLLLLSPLKFVIGKIKRVLHFFASKLKKVSVLIHSRLKKNVKSVRIALNIKRRRRAEKRSKQRELKNAKRALSDSRNEAKKSKKKSGRNKAGNDIARKDNVGNDKAGIDINGKAAVDIPTVTVRRPDRRASYGSIKGSRRS